MIRCTPGVLDCPCFQPFMAQVKLDDGLLQLTVFALDITDFTGIGFSCGISSQVALFDLRLNFSQDP